MGNGGKGAGRRRREKGRNGERKDVNTICGQIHEHQSCPLV